jgi:hypothetical protein
MSDMTVWARLKPRLEVLAAAPTKPLWGYPDPRVDNGLWFPRSRRLFGETTLVAMVPNKCYDI